MREDQTFSLSEILGEIRIVGECGVALFQIGQIVEFPEIHNLV